MRVWCHDSDNRLIRIESNNLFGNLSDSFMHSHTLDIMVDLESNHGDENNLNNENFHAYQPIRTLKIICNLLGVVHHHASFFQLTQIILILSMV